jgi:GDP/UDP-N,N'-diacetylbacillosamine 2-epimerase (hydrolysing)
MGVKIGILTSSRADYSIYYPLIIKAMELPNTQVELIAFGTHLSKQHGYTIDNIIADGFEVKHQLDHCYALNDSPMGISLAMANTSKVFAEFWNENQFDLVFCLGDRYEMFAAVAAAVPYQLNMAHLYGGERTEGAIDDCLRHAISLMSKWNFTACEDYKKRVEELTLQKNRTFNFGHLSIDNLKRLSLLSIEELKDKTGLDFNIPTILCTFHPETIKYDQNAVFANEIAMAFNELNEYQILITMPNSDTGSQPIRDTFSKLSTTNSNVYITENLGTIGYLSAMKHCTMMVGNTSSGFVEASFFPKTVINLGERQTGRIVTSNIINTNITTQEILNAISTNRLNKYNEGQIQIYGTGETAVLICNEIKNNILKNLYQS